MTTKTGLDLDHLTPQDIASAYEGRANRCACGCSGTYYGPEYTEPDSEAKVAKGLARMQRKARKAGIGGAEDQVGTYIFSDGSQCWYYQTTAHLFRIESKARED
jgi:hypothetical protein